jgi:hypothetical protein
VHSRYDGGEHSNAPSACMFVTVKPLLLYACMTASVCSCRVALFAVVMCATVRNLISIEMVWWKRWPCTKKMSKHRVIGFVMFQDVCWECGGHDAWYVLVFYSLVLSKFSDEPFFFVRRISQACRETSASSQSKWSTILVFFRVHLKHSITLTPQQIRKYF